MVVTDKLAAWKLWCAKPLRERLRIQNSGVHCTGCVGRARPLPGMTVKEAGIFTNRSGEKSLLITGLCIRCGARVDKSLGPCEITTA